MSDTQKNKNSMLESLNLKVTRESNRAKELGTSVDTFPVINMFGRETSMGESLQLRIEGEVPYIDSEGNVGTSNILSASASLNMLASSCGAAADKVLPFTVGDFVMTSRNVKDVEIEVTATLEEREGEKRLITMLAITGKTAQTFGKKLASVRQTRLEEASKHADLYASMSAKQTVVMGV